MRTMNRIQLAQLRDIAIEYLPAAQQYREEVKARPTEDRESQGYARALWRIADETIARHEATGEELSAAYVLLGITDYELYDPATLPALNKMERARNPAHNDMSDKDMRDAMLQGIANTVKTLANVTGRDIPMADPVAYFVDPATPAMPAMEQIELSLADVVRINEAAPLMGCTVESLLRQAANDERLLYVALKPHTEKLSAIRSHPNPRTGQTTRNHISFVAMMSRDAVSLATIGSADISQYQASFGGALDWHYWMLDKPQTVGVDMVFVPRSQLPADAPAAKGEAETATSPSGNGWLTQAPAETPSTTDANKPPRARVGEQIQQEDEILRIIRDELKIDPLKLPANLPGKRGIKADVRDKLEWEGTIFEKAWERVTTEKGLAKYHK